MDTNQPTRTGPGTEGREPFDVPARTQRGTSAAVSAAPARPVQLRITLVLTTGACEPSTAPMDAKTLDDVAHALIHGPWSLAPPLHYVRWDVADSTDRGAVAGQLRHLADLLDANPKEHE